MGFYLIQLGYTAEAARTMVKKPHNREKVARTAIESVGGKLHSFFFSFGDYDAVAIVEMPDNTAAAAEALGAASGGQIAKFCTTVLLTAAEAMDAMKLAKKYKPPK